jgi:CheY-like chemotaxis protein
MLNILVVEDDDFFRDMLVLMLEEDGHQVLEAADGVQALQVLQSSEPDLIITDLMMPNMNGAELIAALAERHHSTPVIVMSGGKLHKSAVSSAPPDTLMGIQVHLAKPFSRDALRRAISVFTQPIGL